MLSRPCIFQHTGCMCFRFLTPSSWCCQNPSLIQGTKGKSCAQVLTNMQHHIDPYLRQFYWAMSSLTWPLAIIRKLIYFDITFKIICKKQYAELRHPFATLFPMGFCHPPPAPAPAPCPKLLLAYFLSQKALVSLFLFTLRCTAFLRVVISGL